MAVHLNNMTKSTSDDREPKKANQEELILQEANQNRKSGPIITAEVSGIGLVDAVVESGSTACLIARDLLKDSIKSKLKPITYATATLSDGSKMDLLGRVNLIITYLGKTVELPFYVVSEPLFLMILGTTWIRKSGAILQSDGGKLRVTLGGKKEKEDCRMDVCSSPRVLVDVDGIGIVRAMVVTGYSTSVINRDMLTELQKSKATPSSSITILANGTQVKNELGHVSLNITFEGITTCIENVEIDSNMKYQLRLGMDWIDQTHAVIQSDGSKIIVSRLILAPKEKRSNRVIACLSKHWNSTFGSVSRISSLVSNLM